MKYLDNLIIGLEVHLSYLRSVFELYEEEEKATALLGSSNNDTADISDDVEELDASLKEGEDNDD